MPFVDPKTGKVYREVYSKNGRVFLLPESGNIKDMQAGVIIKCKKCGTSQVVVKGSLCDRWCLCVKCARVRWKLGKVTRVRER